MLTINTASNTTKSTAWGGYFGGMKIYYNDIMIGGLRWCEHTFDGYIMCMAFGPQCLPVNSETDGFGSSVNPCSFGEKNSSRSLIHTTKEPITQRTRRPAS